LPGPGEIIFDEHNEELEAGDFLHFSSVNVLPLPEVHNHLLSLADIEKERLLPWHHVAKSLTSLYVVSSLLVRPRMVVSSANVRMVLELCVATQS